MTDLHFSSAAVLEKDLDWKEAEALILTLKGITDTYTGPARMNAGGWQRTAFLPRLDKCSTLASPTVALWNHPDNPLKSVVDS